LVALALPLADALLVRLAAEYVVLVLAAVVVAVVVVLVAGAVTLPPVPLPPVGRLVAGGTGWMPLPPPAACWFPCWPPPPPFPWLAD